MIDISESAKTFEGFSSKYLLSDVARDLLQKGIAISDTEMLFLHDALLYFLPNKELVRGVVYKKILQRSEVESEGIPRYHIAFCDILKDDFLHRRGAYVFRVPQKNSFDFTVKEGRVDVKVYYDKPLHICPSCLNIYNAIFGTKKGVKEFDFLSDFLLNAAKLPPEEERYVTERYRSLFGDYCDSCGTREVEIKSFVTLKKGRGLFVKSLCKNCLKKDK